MKVSLHERHWTRTRSARLEQLPSSAAGDIRYQHRHQHLLETIAQHHVLVCEWHHHTALLQDFPLLISIHSE